eukprot:scaffold114254_cov112-Phaeocystis_antarctica.AAC.1
MSPRSPTCPNIERTSARGHVESNSEVVGPLLHSSATRDACGSRRLPFGAAVPLWGTCATGVVIPFRPACDHALMPEQSGLCRAATILAVPA